MTVRLPASAALALIVALAGCATPQQKAAVSSGVAAAVVALTEAERVALVYTGLPRCPAATLCSTQATVDRLKSLDNQAYAAVKAAERDQSLLAAALAAVSRLQAAVPAAQ